MAGLAPTPVREEAGGRAEAGLRWRPGRQGEWSVEAVTADGVIAGWSSLRSWAEDDGVRVYLTDGHVAEGFRRRGLGGLLLDRAEAAAARLAAERGAEETAQPAAEETAQPAAEETAQPAVRGTAERAAQRGEGREAHRQGPVVLGGNADETDTGREALLRSRGYERVFTMVCMVRERSPVPRRDLPEGVGVRTVTVGDAGDLRRLAERAWAGRPFVSLPSEERLRDWLQRSDPAGFLVATAGERIVGFIAVTGDEVEDVQVDPDFRRRGIASALLSRALDGMDGPARLRTEAHDPAGARSLYERFGFRVTQRQYRYRKPLR